MELKTNHRHDNPKLPSFHHPTLVEFRDELKRAYDCWNNLRGVKKEYLPREQQEPPGAYKGRLERAVYTPFFRQAIQGFAGVLSGCQLLNPPSTFDTTEQNVDREGNSFQAFFNTCDSHVMRDGGKLIVVDMPPGAMADGAEEAIAGDRIPYLVQHSRATVINWRFIDAPGPETLDWVVIAEQVEIQDGDYGIKVEARYRVIGRGWWKVFKITGAGKAQTAVVESEGTYLDSSQQPLKIVPAIWYPANGEGFGQGCMPLSQLMEHGLEHFRKRSDYNEKEHKCNLPVPVREGMPPRAPGDPPEQLVLGPNTFLDLPAGVTFRWAEPDAGSLAETRAGIEHVEKLIQSEMMAYAYGEASAAKTATQSDHEAGSTQANIRRLSEIKNSVVQQIFQIWTLYTGEPVPEKWGITIDPQVFDRPLTFQDAEAIQRLAGGVEIISQESAVAELQRGGLNRQTSSASDELERIKAEAPKTPPPIDRNAFGNLPPADPADPPDA